MEIAFYRFLFRVTQIITLPSYSGSTFHGGFSHALNCIGGGDRAFFFEPKTLRQANPKNSPPKPFTLIPPQEGKTRYTPGEMMQCGLFLFGNAIRQFMVAYQAMEILGRDLGLGRDEGLFSIESVEQLTLNGAITLFDGKMWYPPQKPVSSLEILRIYQTDADRVRIFLVTRMRLKHDGQLVKDPPPFFVFFNRLIGRINSLARLYGGEMLVPPQLKHIMINSTLSH